MKTNRIIVCLALTSVLALTCTLADTGEVVRFQDGRYLEVEGHQVHGDAVKLMMMNQSVLVLPLDRIDSIRSGRVVVYTAARNHELPAQELQAVVRKLGPEYPEPGSRKRG